MKRMTMRERMLAVVQRRPHDRVPFVQYSDLAGPRQEIWSVVGRANMGILVWCGLARWEHPNCRFETVEIERDGRSGFRKVLHTPEGKLVQEKFHEPTYGTAATHKHFVVEPADYKVLLAFFRDVTVRKQLDDVAGAIAALGEDGLPHVGVGRTPYQQLWVEWVSLQDLCLHLVDEPAVMEEVIAVMTDLLRAMFAIARQAVRELPIPYVVFGDNITAPVIGPVYFGKYCVPLYDELADALAGAGRDVPVFVHMDGDLKPLWQAIGRSKVRGLDSLSPPPDNDTSVASAAAMWPEMRLLVNFPSSVHLRRPEEIRAEAGRILTQAGHTGRLQIQISENVPPGRWRVSFPEIVGAIEAFGRPGG